MMLFDKDSDEEESLFVGTLIHKDPSNLNKAEDDVMDDTQETQDNKDNSIGDKEDAAIVAPVMVNVQQFVNTIGLLDVLHDNALHQEALAQGINPESLPFIGYINLHLHPDPNNLNTSDNEEETNQEPDTDNNYKTVCHRKKQREPEDPGPDMNDNNGGEANFVGVIVNENDSDSENNEHKISAIGFTNKKMLQVFQTETTLLFLIDSRATCHVTNDTNNLADCQEINIKITVAENLYAMQKRQEP